MSSNFKITSEAELSEAVLRILSVEPSGQATYSYLIATIRKTINLTVADKAPSLKRPLEEMWEQRVRNIRSHQGSSGNYITDGLLKGIKGGLKITEAGSRHLAKKA
jgi:hypothetical protein